jgi:glycosyltransferase involved in cell wall biosynthesis
MIGDGPLLGPCKNLACALQIADFVEFLGAQPPDVVAREMKRARAFVQHSVAGSDGNSEGTPVSILEAMATGLPVISTNHAGIPDVVIDGHSGLLVDECDVEGMAKNMLAVARSPELAAMLGRNGSARVRQRYTMEQSISRLARILDAATNGTVAAITVELDQELAEGSDLRRTNGNHSNESRSSVPTELLALTDTLSR